jgi:arylsulfatase A-like enzyme/Tfp pilus assembly protein PilF
MLRWIMVLCVLASSALAATRPNVILITFDSCPGGFSGSKAGLTPSLGALARQSIVFDQAFAQAPTTVVSHATILSGTYPQTHRASEFAAALPTSLPFLPDLLRAQGYRTAAFVSSIALDPKKGAAPGFDRGSTTYSAASSVTEAEARAESWIAANAKPPFFLWLELATAYPSTSNNAAVSAAGKLLAALRALKLYDDSIIVVTASHRESLGAHGEDTHGIFLYDETLHVPLWVKLPQNQPAQRVPARVPLVSIAPTILEAAGVAVPSQMQGQSLLRIAKGAASEQPIYSRSDFPAQAFGWSVLESWRASKYLYIRAPKPELYDLSIDPAATRNLAQTSQATLQTLAAQLAAFGQHFTAAGNQPQLTSSEIQKLASLGYVGLQKPTAAVTAATGTDPKDEIATANRILAAESLSEGGKPDKAIAILQPLMKSTSNSYLAQYLMGVALAQQQKYSQAEEFLHRAIELQPDSSWAHYQMGSALLKAGDFKTAAVHLEIAADRLPEFASAHALLAQAYEHMGKSEDAKREKAKAGP